MIKIREYVSVFGVITISKTKRTGALVYTQGGFCQSEADIHGVSVASYIHAIFGLVAQLPGKSVLLIGCGGGTLGTMLARTGLKVTIVDVNPAAFRLARKYFDLSTDIDCQTGDGCEFLRTSNALYDVIVLDAFEGDQIPQHLRSPEFFALVKSRLAQWGAIFANIYLNTDSSNAHLRLAENMAGVWNNVRILDSLRWPDRNAIVTAGNVSKLNEPIMINPPSVDAGIIEIELAAMEFQGWP